MDQHYISATLRLIRRGYSKADAMLDVIFIGIAVLFFAGSLVYTILCERL
jgi:hypothetical protein